MPSALEVRTGTHAVSLVGKLEDVYVNKETGEREFLLAASGVAPSHPSPGAE